MARILLISLFGSMTGSNSRLLNICKAFYNNNKIIVITSDFSHGRKQYKVERTDNNIFNEIQEIQLHVPSYKKNLSLKRIISHLSFAVELNKYLNSLRDLPDMVYCAMPSSSSAYVTGKWCRKNNIPFIIDVIDIWPDSLLPLMSLKKIASIALAPWCRLTHKSYAMADYISAESYQYMKEAKRHNSGSHSSYTYLGVDIDSVKSMIQASTLDIVKPEDELWICYGGALGQSYDFDTILNSVEYIHKKGIKYRLLFVGEGEKRCYIESEIKKRGLIGKVTGRLSYPDLLKYLSICDIAFNSFNPKTLVVHSYKFNDYVATGCFVMNSLKGETAELIDKYQIGKNYTPESAPELLYDSCVRWNKIKLSINDNLAAAINECLNTSIIYERLRSEIQRELSSKLNMPYNT